MILIYSTKDRVRINMADSAFVLSCQHFGRKDSANIFKLPIELKLVRSALLLYCVLIVDKTTLIFSLPNLLLGTVFSCTPTLSSKAQ